MQELRQSTEVIVRVGPFVFKSDHTTPINDRTLEDFYRRSLYKAGDADPVDLLNRKWSMISDRIGCYNLTLSIEDTNALGLLTLSFCNSYNTDPVFMRFMVVRKEYWDAKYGDLLLEITKPEVY